VARSAIYDAVVIGAGIVGAACSYYLARAGLSVAVVDRGAVAAGTTGAGEGNILVSDKAPGPELELALLSNRLWRQLGAELDPAIELETKGGLVVADTEAGNGALLRFAAGQAAAGLTTQVVDPDGLRDLEPHLRYGLAGGVFYPQDLQVQPMMAAAQLLLAARARGAEIYLHEEVTEIIVVAGFSVAGSSVAGSSVAGSSVAGSSVAGIKTARHTFHAALVVNATGTWAGETAGRAGLQLPVLPRRGFIVVTEPLPPLIRHKVYSADYVANVASDAADLEISTVVEATKSGPVLIGASRERVGFDRDTSFEVVGRLARQAVKLFPVLAESRAIRFYRGFRPYCPDHLPVIGEDPRLRGLVHACGHEGAGVGLAPATGHLIAQVAAGAAPELALLPFSPARFVASSVSDRV
jgi:glycine/D-amino acid oxidase-like deaminating enzyme